MSKEATVYIIDVNPAMGNASESGKSSFQTSKLILQKLLLEKMISGRKGDQIGLVFVGSSQSCNRQLQDRSEEEVEAKAYEGILDFNFYSIQNDPTIDNYDLENPLQMASIEMMKFLQNLEPSKDGDGGGDFMDALVVGIKMIISHCTSKSTGKPLKYNKKICIFTNGSGDGVSTFPTWCQDLADPVVEQLTKNEIATLVCGFDFDIEPDVKFEENSPRSLLMRFVKRDDELGQFVTGEDALQAIYDTSTKSSVRPTTTFRGDLTYGNVSENADYALSIPIYAYVKTKSATIPSAKKAFYSTKMVSDSEKQYLDSADVARSTAYYKVNQDEDGDAAAENEVDHGEQIERDELVRGYRYGKHIVPFTDADELASKMKTEKCMEIICFTPSSKIPRYCFMSNVLAIVPDPFSKVAAEKLASLSAALQVKDHVAIVRYCRSDDSSPKLAILSSNTKGYLYFNQIPFADDIRHWTFRPFDFLANDIVNSKSSFTSKCLPLKRRLEHVSSTRKHTLDARKVSKSKAMEAINGLIDVLDCSGEYERLWPKKIGNVGLEKVYDAIMKKTLGDTFQGFGENDITIPAEQLSNLDSICSNLQNVFELSLVPEKVHRGRIRKVAPSFDKKVQENEIEFSFLDEDTSTNAEIKVEKPVDVGNAFDFLDF